MLCTLLLGLVGLVCSYVLFSALPNICDIMVCEFLANVFPPFIFTLSVILGIGLDVLRKRKKEE